MSKKTAKNIAEAVNDRLVKCGGCSATFHLSNEYTGPVEATRCFKCTEFVAQQMGVEVTELREQMRSIRHMRELPFGWPESRWAHERGPAGLTEVYESFKKLRDST